jgi:PAS domain S-box-containing protein
MNKEMQRKARKEQALLDAALQANVERLRAEKELRLVEQRQAAILQSLPIILYLEELNINPRMPKFVGGNFTALTGFSFEEIQHSPSLWVDRLHPEDRERVLEAVAQRPTGRSMSVEYRWQCADGQYRHFIDQAVLLRDPLGNPVEYAGTLFDVTERKDLEVQLNQVRKMDAIGQLTGGIAHDFNNLLAAVLGGLGMIERRVPLDDKQKNIIDMMRHAAEQGAELVKHLLAFARRQKLAPGVIDVNQLATSVTRLLDHTLGGLVELKWDVQDGTSDVFADTAQLELALMNLIINARDAMPEGGIITVGARNAEVIDGAVSDLAPGKYVAFAVSDTGCGIAPHLLDQVMEPFFTTKAVGKGTGLGLSMVYGFAQQSGGTVRVNSQLGAGTCVEIWLPEAQRERAPDTNSPPDHALSNPGKALNILLVDDHDAVRATTASLLEDMGHRVTDVADGLSALDMIRSDAGRFDILVTDYAMPKISGTQLVKQVRSILPEFAAIIITGYADARELLRDDLEVDILEKPFTPEKLHVALCGCYAKEDVKSAEEPR